MSARLQRAGSTQLERPPSQSSIQEEHVESKSVSPMDLEKAVVRAVKLKKNLSRTVSLKRILTVASQDSTSRAGSKELRRIEEWRPDAGPEQFRNLLEKNNYFENVDEMRVQEILKKFRGKRPVHLVSTRCSGLSYLAAIKVKEQVEHGGVWSELGVGPCLIPPEQGFFRDDVKRDDRWQWIFQHVAAQSQASKGKVIRIVDDVANLLKPTYIQKQEALTAHQLNLHVFDAKVSWLGITTPQKKHIHPHLRQFRYGVSGYGRWPKKDHTYVVQRSICSFDETEEPIEFKLGYVAKCIEVDSDYDALLDFFTRGKRWVRMEDFRNGNIIMRKDEDPLAQSSRSRKAAMKSFGDSFGDTMLRTMAERTFAEIDTKNTGKLEREELKKFAMTVLDFAKPGTSFDEYKFDQCFRCIEKNDDGTVSREELIPPLRAAKGL